MISKEKIQADKAMRKIEFRGKGLSGGLYDGVWLFGDLVQDNRGGCYVYPSDCDGLWKENRVDPKSVGQYTGLKDKNGTKIYDGDLLRFPAKDRYEKDNYVLYEVFWHDNDCASNHIGWQMNRLHFQGALCGIDTGLVTFLPKYVNKMEVIGNVYDNKYLLKR